MWAAPVKGCWRTPHTHTTRAWPSCATQGPPASPALLPGCYSSLHHRPVKMILAPGRHQRNMQRGSRAAAASRQKRSTRGRSLHPHSLTSSLPTQRPAHPAAQRSPQSPRRRSTATDVAFMCSACASGAGHARTHSSLDSDPSSPTLRITVPRTRRQLRRRCTGWTPSPADATSLNMSHLRRGREQTRDLD